ncbi:MAG TPA: AtpZ/AtpI family protein [Stellaceae bacterium]|nr:AtpZ/AtpI family protein [Stellaceae bacterium]
MTEPERPDPLAVLGERLERARRARQSGRRVSDEGADQSSRAAMGLGFRIGLELVVAVFVGVAIGWAIDRWLGTRPWGLLAFLFLGIGAGMTNIYRVVKGLGNTVGYKGDGGGSPEPGKGERGKGDWDDDED